MKNKTRFCFILAKEEEQVEDWVDIWIQLFDDLEEDNEIHAMYNDVVFDRIEYFKLKKLHPVHTDELIDQCGGTDFFSTLEFRNMTKRHRVDGPAVVTHDYCGFYLDDTFRPFDVFLKLTPIPNEEKMLLKLKYGKK